MNRYVLDSNIFIQAFERIYRKNIFPGFWEWLEYEIGKHHFLITENVYQELAKDENKLTVD